MTQHPPVLSVIIPVYNGGDILGRCLDALYQSRFQSFEVIVVDDGSPERPDAITSRYPCRLVDQENAGPGPARNLGVQLARGEILFFLDADILVNPDSLGRVVEAFEQRPEIGALFGSFGTETPPENFISVYKNLVHHYTHQTADEEAATFCGGFGAIRRSVFDSVGGFHRPYRFLEDVEIGYRLHLAGVRIRLVKDLQFTHMKRYSLLSLIRSDLFGRAIPWTRLMLSLRLYRNDLNTRTHNVLSVPCSILLALVCLSLPLAAYAGHAMPALAVLAVLTAGFGWLNRAFLGFLLKLKGPWFALRSAGMLCLGYLYSALGVGIGTWLHMTSPIEPFQMPVEVAQAVAAGDR